MNILFCGNSRAFDGILIAALSIIKYYKGPLDIYVMTANLQDMDEAYAPICWQQARLLEDIVSTVCSQSRVLLIDKTMTVRGEIEGWVNQKTIYTPYSLLRLYADTLPVDRLLYLDADVVACGNIEALYETDIEQYELAGARDFLGRWFIGHNYINTGVLLLNLRKCRERALLERARIICKYRKLFFPDQTAINLLCHDKYFLPAKYNEQKRYRPDTVIQHFCKSLRIFPYIHTVNVKPWEVDKLHRVYRLHVHDEVLGQYEAIKRAACNVMVFR